MLENGNARPRRSVRQRNEAAVYDARAALLLGSAQDGELLIDREIPPFANREHVDFLSYALERLGRLAGRRILEVGCGTGALSVYLGLQGAEVVGIDVSDGNIDVARRRALVNGVAGRVHFEPVPVESLDHRDRSYDAVVGNQVLHHFEIEEAMRNIRRLLVPGGRGVFCEPVLFLPNVVRTVRSSRMVTSRFPLRTDTPDERSISLSDLERIQAPFARSEWRPFQLLCRLQNFVDLSDEGFRRLWRIDQLLLRRVPMAWRLCRYIVLVLETETEEPRPRRREGGQP